MNTSNSQAVYIDNTQFLDISSHWAKEDIEHMLSLGIVKGKTPQTFAPDLNINRAEFAALVLRALEPQIEFYSEIKTDEFIDINEDAWYKDIVYTAVEIGLFADESNYFRPEESITREEMAKVIVSAYRFAGGKEQIPLIGADVFEDKNKISDWAIPYVGIAYEVDLIKGINEKEFAPQDEVTRAQGVVVIKRLLDNITN
jgi:hypothetical protein